MPSLAAAPDRSPWRLTASTGTLSCAVLVGRLSRLPDRVIHQRLAERPDRAGNLVAAGDLGEDLVVLEQRHRDELAEQAFVGGLEHIPGGLQPQRFRRTELDSDHQ